MNKRMPLLVTLAVLLALSFGGGRVLAAHSQAQAADPAALGSGFTYQGQLKDGNGKPVTDTCSFQFTLWDSLSNLTGQVGSPSEVDSVQVTDGQFTALVNSGDEFGSSAFNGQPRWLEIGVKCSADSSFTPLSPRQALSSAPYATFAVNADTLDGQQSSSFASASHDHWGASWSGTGTGLTLNSDTTGLSATGDTYGVYGRSESTNGNGVYGYASSSSGNANGVTGQTDSTGGTGVLGIAGSTTGKAYGLFGWSSASEGAGILGASMVTGTIGIAYASSGVSYGVVGLVSSSDGYAGYFSSSAGNGVTIRVPAGKVGLNVLSGQAQVGGNAIWHAGNDGSGSGLDADLLDGQHASAFSLSGHNHWGATWSGSGTGLTLSGGAIGLSGSGSTYGVYGQSASTNGYGVYGYAASPSGITIGVWGQSDSTDVGTGVYGYASASLGVTSGVLGKSSSTTGVGVQGLAPASSGTTFGVYGSSNSASGYGVYGRDSSGIGVYGTSTSDTGVYGTSTSGFGVYGSAASTSGETYGVIGYSNGWAGVRGDGPVYGVYGAGATGVRGVSSTTNGVGLSGLALSSSGTNYGVYGRSDSASGYAGYFNGNVHVTGSLTDSGGSFKIDNPVSPSSQYLYQSSVESPDMKNIYDGVVTLDASGEAWVQMPDWFEALNGSNPSDYRYQLTCIGGYAPVYIAQEVQANQFKIAGGTPGLKVSWQVTGIRHDPYAEANRIPVVQDKPANEQGTYLFPALYGQPASAGVNASTMPANP